MPKRPQHLIKLLPHKKAFFCEEGQRVLDAALASGHALPFSCRGGNCGRCAARVPIGSYRYDRDTPPPGLSADMRASGMALLCQIVPEGPLTVEVPARSEAGMQPVVKLPCRIVERHHVAPDVMKLKLQLPRTQPLEFRAGQYLDVLFDRGRRRSYSMASLPHSAQSGDDASHQSASHIELHVRRVEGGLFSTLAFDADSGSSLLRIEGPHGHFGWQDPQVPAIMIAGGTGFAPLKSMLLDAIDQQRSTPVHLFWGARDAADLYERPLVERWQSEHPWFRFTPVLSQVSHVRKPVAGAPGPTMPRPRLFERALDEAARQPESIIYAAGPPGLIERVQQESQRLGIREDRLVLDAFDHAVV